MKYFTQMDRRELLPPLFAVLWPLMWAFLVLGLNIEWQRFALLALTLGLLALDLRLGLITFRPLLRKRSTFLFLIFFAAFSLQAIIWLLAEDQSLRTARNWLTFCVIGLGAVYCLGWNSFKLSVLGICVGVIVSVPLWLLYVYWPEYSLMTPLYQPDGQRLALFMENVNDLGKMMGWGCCLWFFLRFNKQRIVAPGPDWLLLLVMAVPLLLSWSRTSILAAAVIVLCMWVTLPRLSAKKLLLALSCLLLAFVALQQAPMPQHPQLRRLASVITAPHKDDTLISRLPLWEVAWLGYLQSPVYGNGMGSYSRLHNQFLTQYGDEFRKKYPMVEIEMHRAHNLPLGVMSDLGTIGLALFVGLYASGLAAGASAAPPFKIGLYALLFSLIQGLTDSVLYETWTALIIFSACGGTLAGRLRRPERENAGRAWVITPRASAD